MAFLLDTNAWVRYLRDPDSPIRYRLASLPPNEVKMCSVVLTELYRGALRSRDPAGQRTRIDSLVRPYDSLPFDDPAAARYAELRVNLERGGRVIGPHDMMIAAIALAHGLTVVTHNTGEFSRVPGLAIDDWETP